MNLSLELYIDSAFPNLRSSGYKITSPFTPEYNCIAWAANDDEVWWWPDKFNICYWPSGVPREETLEAFILAYKTIGYSICENSDFEENFEKIAIYCDKNGKPTHASRSIDKNMWTSKIGKSEDIEHRLDGLISQLYGEPKIILKRKKN